MPSSSPAQARYMSAYRKWYVYEVLDEHGACIYVGKGTATRMFASLAIQEGVSVRAVAYFNCELAALAFERDLIWDRDPARNVVKTPPAHAKAWLELLEDTWFQGYYRVWKSLAETGTAECRVSAEHSEPFIARFLKLVPGILRQARDAGYQYKDCPPLEDFSFGIKAR